MNTTICRAASIATRGPKSCSINASVRSIAAQILVQRGLAFDAGRRALGREREFGDDVVGAHVSPAFHVLGKERVEALAQQICGRWGVLNDDNLCWLPGNRRPALSPVCDRTKTAIPGSDSHEIVRGERAERQRCKRPADIERAQVDGKEAGGLQHGANLGLGIRIVA